MTQTDHILEPIAVAHKVIGPGNRVFVIAEAGVNHNGRTDLALELIETARQAGADCVKFQTFSAKRIATPQAEKAPYQRLTTQSGGSQIDMLRALELPADAYPALIASCRACGLVFLSTPYSPEDADLLESLGAPAYKVASAQLVEPSFLQHIASKGRPILLSTGMATLAEVDEAVRAIRQTGHNDIVLLQCTSNYPSAVEDANLRVLRVLRERFGLNVGYSDHTSTVTCCTAATALGAVVIEKHLTLDKSLPGPDHSASASPEEFRRLVDAIREVEGALGTGVKEPTPAERANLPYMRRSIVASTVIRAGEMLTPDMLAFKRPASGISPARLHEVVGARARVDLKPDQILLWSDLDR
jgi:N-acetylneuraminate synthase/N,N'-diacetyllegionaminate synthase